MSVMEALTKAWEANPEATESMIDDIVLDLLADEALDNAPLLNRSAAAFVGHRVAVAKRALLRQYASDVAKGHYPDEEVHKAALWLSGLEAYALDVVGQQSLVRKDDDGHDPWAPVIQSGGSGQAKWQEQKHKRDSRGRFSRGVNQGRKVNPLQYGSLGQVAKPLRSQISVDPNTGERKLGANIDPDRAARTQAQYEEADEILREFGSAFSASERKNINVMLQIRQGDQIKRVETRLSDLAHGASDELYDSGGLKEDTDILAIEIDAGPKADADLAQKVRQFNTMGAMGGSYMASLSTLPADKRTRMMDSLMPRGPEQGRLKSMFGRFNAGADVLEHQGHDKLAGMARFMGEYGPEAERVMDPRVRQAAYRYRGTEKEPDIELMRHMNAPQMNVVEAAARESGHGDVSERVKAGTNRMGVTPPVEGSLRYRLQQADRTGEHVTEDQLAMQVRSDVAASHLMRTIPLDRMVSDLSRKSGNILPSQGVLIDADGDVVSQAVGFGDDTYLPFDYSNMKRSMRGGQYVRTRVQGGLTGEDIAAAVNGGARMVTVVSSSGVHSIEFDPNLRGTRAGSDKARAMSRRYLQILDAVENSGLYTQDIDPREKSRLRAQAAEMAGSHQGQDFQEAYKRLETEARAKSSQLSEEEMDGLMDQATKMVASEGGSRSPDKQRQRINDVYVELEQQASKEKASKLRLNAEGYHVALQTLQQQFPYFIRNVEYQPLASTDSEEGFLNSRGQQPTAGSLRQRLKSTDEGYMRPGGTRAHTVQSGFYRTDDARPGMKPAMGGARFADEEAARNAPKAPPPGPEAGGAAATPPGEPGTPGAEAPTTPGVTGPVESPTGGLSARAAYMKAATDAEKGKALTELTNIFNTLAAHRVTAEGTIARKPWEQVKDMDNAGVAAWFLGQEDPKAALTDPAKSGRIAMALSDREATKKAFKSALQGGAGQADFFLAGNDFGGRTTPEEAADYAADLAMSVVDADLMAQPFVSQRQGNEALYHRGSRPQALKINGTDINSLLTQEQLTAFVRSNPNIGALAEKIGTEQAGGQFKPYAAVAADVSERIAVLEALPKIISAAQKDPARKTDLVMPAHLYISPNLPPDMTPEKFSAAFTRMYGQAPATDADLIGLTRGPKPDQQAKDLQAAWSVIGAGRAIQMTTGGGRVGGPKVPAAAPGQPQVRQGDIFKASPRDASTRLERVRKDSSPLAQEISRRRAAGLPFVPARPRS